jgi:hypothetical protein
MIIRQMLVKTLFLQSEFGIKAGSCFCSCRRSQKMKAGISNKAIVSMAMFPGIIILDNPLERALLRVTTPPRRTYKTGLTREHKKAKLSSQKKVPHQPNQPLSQVL